MYQIKVSIVKSEIERNKTIFLSQWMHHQSQRRDDGILATYTNITIRQESNSLFLAVFEPLKQATAEKETLNATLDSKSLPWCTLWSESPTHHSWWINLMLPVQMQGWYNGLSGVPSARHTRQMSPKRYSMPMAIHNQQRKRPRAYVRNLYDHTLQL